MGANKNIKQKDWDLLAKELFDKPAGERNVRSLQSMLSSVDQAEADHVARLSQQIDLHFKLKKYPASSALQQVKYKIRKQSNKTASKSTGWKAIKIAAAIVLAVIIGATAYFTTRNQLVNPSSAAVAVDDLGLSQIELSDGSMVTLNKNSKIHYPDQFGSDVREVSIEGEAFFEVIPNPSKPFIIHAGEATIKVLGTSFSVHAYPENDKVEVIVESGKVQFSKLLTNQKTIHEVILDPGEKGTYINASKELTKCINNNPNFLSWKTRRLIFRETSLKEVVEQLNNTYNVRIEIADPDLHNLLLNAHFERESLDFILTVIATTHGLKVDQKDENYLLKKET